MCTASEEADGFTTFCLSGDVSVKDIRQTHAALCEAAPVDGRLKIDATEVTSTDTAVLQLLLATRRQLPQTAIELPTNVEVTTVLEQIGVAALVSNESANGSKVTNALDEALVQVE